MSWLIEAFIDEEYFDEAETATKVDRFGRVYRGNGYTEWSPKTRDQAKRSNSTKVYEKEFAQKRSSIPKVVDNTADKAKYLAAKSYANKQLKPGLFKKADEEQVAQAADSIVRHNRRHPDNKVGAKDVDEFDKWADKKQEDKVRKEKNNGTYRDHDYKWSGINNKKSEPRKKAVIYKKATNECADLIEILQ